MNTEQTYKSMYEIAALRVIELEEQRDKALRVLIELAKTIQGVQRELDELRALSF